MRRAAYCGLDPSGSEDIVQLALGDDHSCALSGDGAVSCWGRDDFGQSSPPDDLDVAQVIVAGGDHTCAILSDGSPHCWGRDDEEQIDGLLTYDYESLTLGGAHTCGLKRDSFLACWGRDDEGQLAP